MMDTNRIAITSSYFNCPIVDRLLKSCVVVFTTNEYAILNYNHKNIRHIRDYNPDEFLGYEIIDFQTVRTLFLNWVKNTATNEELNNWCSYFGVTSPEEIRRKI